MITGKDIITYILENDLVNEPVISNVSDILATPEEVAVKFGVGTAVVETMYELGLIKGFNIGGKLYFSKSLERVKGDENR